MRFYLGEKHSLKEGIGYIPVVLVLIIDSLLCFR
jgi:hypothetical protein